MDLLADTRRLVHAGRLLRQPDGSLDISGWSELFVLLFDNYRTSRYTLSQSYLLTVVDCKVVMTKPKEKDGVTKYYVNKRVSLASLL